jgi:serine/threonine protein kinase/tetratricopeptide (TPR) repeat protein
MPDRDPCPDYDSLARLALGTLPEAERAALALHVETCQRCREALGKHSSAPVTPPPVRSEDTGLHPEQRTLFQTRSMRVRGPVDDLPGDPVEPTPPPVPPPAAPPFPFLGPSSRPDGLGRLGPFDITRVLGQGGMGTVFLAEDPELSRPVAVKVMKPELARDPFARQRFLREARATAGVRSPHIVTIYKVGQDNDVPYLAMEYLHGQPLDRWLEGRKLTPAQSVRLGRGIAAGLAAAHEAGLVHRDVKPGNIWIEDPPASSPNADVRVKILDFGLARSAQDNVNLTQSGLVVGTPAYMAPEQADGAPVDARCDIFSLGCILYRLCTGQPPFAGPTVMALLKAIALKEPVPPRDLKPQLSRSLSDLILWLLAKNPARRPGSAREVEAMLATIERELETAGDSAALSGVALALKSAPTPVPDAASAVSGAVDEHPTEITITPPGQPKSGPQLRGERRRFPLRAAVLLAIGLALGSIATILMTGNRAGKGTIELRSEEPTARVLIERDGQPVAGLDTASRSTTQLPPGEYQLRLEGNPPDLQLVPDQVRLGPGDQLLVHVQRREGPVVPLNVKDKNWRQSVEAMPPPAQADAVAARLRERNPGYAGRPQFTIEDGAITRVRMGSDAVTDLSPLQALPKMWELYCFDEQGMGRLADLRPLRGMRLRYLHIGGNEVSDLSPLKEMRLQALVCQQNPIRDLSPLKGIPLETLSFTGCRVRDLSPLKGMPLRHLNISANPITSLAPLAENSVTELICSNTPVRDLSPLRGLRLHKLEIDGTNVRDLTPLRDLPLKEVTVDVRTEADLAALEAIPGLLKVNGRQAAEFFQACAKDLNELKQAREAQANPPEPAACLAFSRLLVRYGDPRAAEALLSAKLETHKDDLSLFMERGKVRAYEGQWARAAEDYERAYQLKPSDPILAQVAATLWLQAGDRPAYRRVCQRVLADHGTSPRPFNQGIVALAGMQEPGAIDAAVLVRLAQAARNAEPGNDVWSTALGGAYLRTGQFELASRTLLEALGRPNPQNAWRLADYVVLAMAQYQLGNKTEARRYLEQATHAYNKQILHRRVAPLVPLTEEYWWDTVSYLILRREAETLLQIHK